MEVESIAEKNLDQLITDIIISMNLKGIKLFKNHILIITHLVDSIMQVSTEPFTDSI
jgi:hypothetical protein